MKTKTIFLALLAGALLALSPSLFAVDTTGADGGNADNPIPEEPQVLLPGPVPDELVVNFNGLDWVWASPCIHGGCSNPDPANQEGWRYATDEELQNSPACDAFIRDDDSLRCSSPYFDPTHDHCDLSNCQSGAVGSAEGQPCIDGQIAGHCESFYVRGDLVEGTTTARFHVTKTFTDGSTDEVQVMLTCDDGLPLTNSAMISGGGDGVTFVVNDFESGTMNCEVTESGHGLAYTPVYNDGNGCAFTNVSSGQYACVISNEANDATFEASVDWNLVNETGDEIDEDVLVTITCDAEITGSNGTIVCGPDCFTATKTIGDGETLWVTASTLLGPVECSAAQGGLPSGVETSDNCGDRDIAAGSISQCTFTNTVFFEGVPTLSQYGLALMALLMLGVGFIGFRRFV